MRVMRRNNWSKIWYEKIFLDIYQNSVAMVTAESGEIEPAIPR